MAFQQCLERELVQKEPARCRRSKPGSPPPPVAPGAGKVPAFQTGIATAPGGSCNRRVSGVPRHGNVDYESRTFTHPAGDIDNTPEILDYLINQ